MKDVLARDVVKKFGDFTALSGVTVHIPAGQVITLLGPSGCGKTTLLRCIAGLEKADGGEIRFGDAVMSSADQRVMVPTEKRNLGMVFQSYAVWPHMTVFNNVAYGLKLRKVSGAEVRERVMRVLDLVGLEGREGRYPSELSGGQQQRVVLARALAYEPEVLLLDEPLANLDAKLREQMRFELRQIQVETGVTAVYVTHDQHEAMAISDQIVVMSNGRVEQTGTAEEIYELPINDYVADFVGLGNFLDVASYRDMAGEEKVVVETEIGEFVANRRRDVPEPAKIMVRPENAVLLEDGSRPEVNVWPGEIKDKVYLGEITTHTVSLKGSDFRVHQSGPSRQHVGDHVDVHVAPNNVVLLGRHEE
ncbi:MAG: ABC transporter ATP-binding protein [Dehalococcoidia bacterium]